MLLGMHLDFMRPLPASTTIFKQQEKRRKANRKSDRFVHGCHLRLPALLHQPKTKLENETLGRKLRSRDFTSTFGIHCCTLILLHQQVRFCVQFTVLHIPCSLLVHHVSTTIQQNSTTCYQAGYAMLVIVFAYVSTPFHHASSSSGSSISSIMASSIASASSAASSCCCTNCRSSGRASASTLSSSFTRRSKSNASSVTSVST